MFGSIIAAGSSLLGGLFGQSNQNKQMDKQIAAQREFAQHGVRWKVDDAKAAGVHPLYALGANTHSFSPIGLGSNDLGAGVAGAGQEIGRAIDARGTAPERAYTASLQKLQLQRGELENALLASQLARMNSPSQLPPPTPLAGAAANRWLVDGQAQSAPPHNAQRFPGPLVEDLPQQRVTSDPGRLHQEPAAITDVGHARTQGGGYAPVPSEDVKQRIEDQMIPSLGWALRNYGRHYYNWLTAQPPAASDVPFKAPAGQYWEWHPGLAEWKLRKY